MKILKAIAIGAITGSALFFLPFFILRGVMFVLFIGFVIRLIAFGRYRRHGFRGRGFDARFTDNIRSMSDEDYQRFKQRWGGYSRKPETVTTIPID